MNYPKVVTKNSNERYKLSIEKSQWNIDEIAIQIAWHTYEISFTKT